MKEVHNKTGITTSYDDELRLLLDFAKKHIHLLTSKHKLADLQPKVTWFLSTLQITVLGCCSIVDFICAIAMD